MSTEAWADTIRRKIDIVTELERVGREIEGWIWTNVVGTDVLPRQLPADLELRLKRLHDGLREVEQLAKNLFARMCSDPSAGFLHGSLLSAEEFYLLRAMGAEIGMLQALRLSTVDEYQLFQLLWYEDGSWKGYINPIEEVRDPQPVRVIPRIGRPPEELREAALRVDQRAFFQKYLPRVYARFQKV